MNRKLTTLGIGAALIGTLVALVTGRKSIDKALAKAVDLAGTEPAGTSSTASGSDGASPSASSSEPTSSAPTASTATDTPAPDSGPTAHAAPAPTGGEGHAAPDLAAGTGLGPDARAPEAFRPNMDAPMTAAERQALRPATGPSPSLVSDRGSSVGDGNG